MYKKVEKCRICGNHNLVGILDLGKQMLTGVFPKSKDDEVTVGPLKLVKCYGDNACGLVQMEHSYDLGEMYGDNYGYRSGLNASMVAHLKAKVKRILSKKQLKPGDLVIDIGSNDSTTLQAYPAIDLNLVGIDPTGKKFKSFYPSHIKLIPDFFSSNLVKQSFPNQKAKVVTSFSMFYDLEAPLDFMREVYEILDDNGIWVFEQSYMPTMLETNSYDTVCHEHLEFYALKQIQWMANNVGFKIIDVEFNDINGGSFSITIKKANSDQSIIHEIQMILDAETDLGLDTLKPFAQFEERVKQTRNNLLKFISEVKGSGKTIAALGASTKGNVLLQYCGITTNEVSCVGEVNTEKFGCFTPGSWLPIISEDDLLSQNPDYLIVLPWHFKSFFVGQEKFKNTTLVFPLPSLELVV
ncbi:class I SAM-dependent methyltransferase [Candidatus Methylopumilus universalis]|uniref:class I SAM-dependent methyltransferase n=1 Tax=Candidatus Methylopumilus universalis TaxID=2588536 RepID=UPI003BEEBCE7